MASKKGLVASTPAVQSNPSTFQGIVDTSAPSSIEESSTFAIRTAYSDESPSNTNIVPTKQTTLELLFKAIEVVGVPRKGASYVAILRWITDNKENFVIGQLRAILKKTILKALDTGLLKRANVSKNSIGLRGYFLMNKESSKKDVKTKMKTKAAPKKKKDDKEPNENDSASDTEVIRKPRKKNVEGPNNSATEVVGRKKVLYNATSKQDGVKKAPSKVEKVKTVAASKNNAKAESAPKTAAVSVPKKKITKASRALMDETVILPRKESVKKATKTSGPKVKAVAKTTAAATSKPKTKAGNEENIQEAETALKPKKGKAKTKPVGALIHQDEPEATEVKMVAGTSKPKTKAGNKENIQDAETASKPKKGKAKTKQGKVQINRDEPEMTEVKVVAEKALKAPMKTQKKAEINDPTTKKKFNPSRMNPLTKMSRKDLSDTELSVRPDNRKSLKSYSSDTEIEVLKKKKITKKPKIRSDTTETKKFVNEKNEAGPSEPKATRKQKAKTAS